MSFAARCCIRDKKENPVLERDEGICNNNKNDTAASFTGV